MYLKSLEMTGFKSFAPKTKLVFEPGMTAIVGPNGCGKSNISDAIRWVLGEQSAKAMRGSSMEDCIFGGTDKRKPMGMAEVSITFADCDAALEIEYNEVTITRRVFRSGEGQYFINKAPCRLKDVQRLFMGTGVGTSSYSFMAQGRIDQILSARPDDRRAVFEEASGITKFKADKKEAIRKLEHTEANLLRLADVIREVKRQIGSLQRQAGRARRYKEMKEELRGLDVFSTRRRLAAADEDIREIESQTNAINEKVTTLQQDVQDSESGNTVIRESLTQTERQIATVMETVVQAQTRLDHTHEMISMNRQRIEEYQKWSSRDSHAIDEIQKQVEEEQGSLKQLVQEAVDLRKTHQEAEAELRQSNERLAQHQEEIDATRHGVRRLREESIATETLISRLQNQVVEIEARERSTVLRRERMIAEQSQLKRAVTIQERRRSEVSKELETLQNEVQAQRAVTGGLDAENETTSARLGEIRETLADLQSQTAAREAQLEMLRESDENGEGFAEGSRLLLDASNPLGVKAGTVVGALAEHLTVDEGYGPCVEVSLRAWLDSVVVSNRDAAMDILHAVSSRQAGAIRLLALDLPPLTPDLSLRERGVEATDADFLLDHVRASEDLQPLLARLLGNVVVVDAIEAVPADMTPGAIYTTRDGASVHADGRYEIWAPESGSSSPLARRQTITRTEEERSEIRTRVDSLQREAQELRTSLDRIMADSGAARAELDARRQAFAQKQGESQVVAHEATEAGNRLETVTFEIDSMGKEGEAGVSEKTEATDKIKELREQRDGHSRQIEEMTEVLHSLEGRQSDLLSTATENRIRFAGLSQKLEHQESRRVSVETHIRELQSAEQGRSEGIRSYREGIDTLTAEIESAEKQLQTLAQAVEENGAKEESLRRSREKQAGELRGMEDGLSGKRRKLSELQEAKSKLDIRRTESTVRRQNHIERITSEYRTALDELMAEDDPEWEGDPPAQEEVETRVAELRTKMEAMGPINLVAIEEYKDLEERYAFLTTQQDDLVKSKQQLMDMIRRINRTTTEMFSTTFEQANTNFQDMFKRLFNGGSAKLVLVDEEDVLESGIEIIARPPGKRLQNVSLLSGGERTLTAVALLFAIYMIKPSPFCLLDEIDAALDDANIGRFVHMLQGFLAQSQFVVITHNRQTIGAGHVLYGVTMPEQGVSRIVSMRFAEAAEAAS